MVRDHGTHLAFAAEMWSGENQTNGPVAPPLIYLQPCLHAHACMRAVHISIFYETGKPHPYTKYMVEVSIPTITLTCVICTHGDIYIKGKQFGPTTLIRARLYMPANSYKNLHAKPGSDEGHWAETSAIYININ